MPRSSGTARSGTMGPSLNRSLNCWNPGAHSWGSVVTHAVSASPVPAPAEPRAPAARPRHARPRRAARARPAHGRRSPAATRRAPRPRPAPRERGELRCGQRRDHQVRDQGAAHGVPDRPLRLGGETARSAEVNSTAPGTSVTAGRGPEMRAPAQAPRSFAAKRPCGPARRRPRPAERHPGHVAVLHQVAGDRHALSRMPVGDVPGVWPGVWTTASSPTDRRRAARVDPVRRDREPSHGSPTADPRCRLRLVRGHRQPQRRGAARVVGVEVRQRDPDGVALRRRRRAAVRSRRRCRCPCRQHVVDTTTLALGPGRASTMTSCA